MSTVIDYINIKKYVTLLFVHALKIIKHTHVILTHENIQCFTDSIILIGFHVK